MTYVVQSPSGIDLLVKTDKGYEIWCRAPYFNSFDIYGDDIKYKSERVELAYRKIEERAKDLGIPCLVRTARDKHLEIEWEIDPKDPKEILKNIAEVLDSLDFAEIERVSEANIRSAIVAYLLENQGEEITVEALFKELLEAGFFRSYLSQILGDLFVEQKGVVLAGSPFGTSVVMPEGFTPESVFVEAREKVYAESMRTTEKFLPTYHRLATEPIE